MSHIWWSVNYSKPTKAPSITASKSLTRACWAVISPSKVSFHSLDHPNCCKDHRNSSLPLPTLSNRLSLSWIPRSFASWTRSTAVKLQSLKRKRHTHFRCIPTITTISCMRLCNRRCPSSRRSATTAKTPVQCRSRLWRTKVLELRSRSKSSKSTMTPSMNSLKCALSLSNSNPNQERRNAAALSKNLQSISQGCKNLTLTVLKTTRWY